MAMTNGAIKTAAAFLSMAAGASLIVFAALIVWASVYYRPTLEYSYGIAAGFTGPMLFAMLVGTLGSIGAVFVWAGMHLRRS